MKNTRSLIVVLALAAAMAYSCKQATNEETIYEMKSAEQTASASSPESEKQASPTAFEKTPIRKFIRTAELRFKAKDVAKTTYAIENITAKAGGFVASTNLQSNTRSEETNKINSDSSVVTKHFTVENQMVLRVPNIKLDSTIKAITPLIDHLDLRVIKADDVSLKLLANTMAQNRTAAHAQRLEKNIDLKGKKLNHITNAEEIVSTKKESSDNSKMDNLSLKDQVEYSTVNIALYQSEAVSREWIANPDNDKYIQGFGSRMIDSLQTGWNMITGLLVFFTNLWPFILIGLLTFFTYKRYKIALKK